QPPLSANLPALPATTLSFPFSCHAFSINQSLPSSAKLCAAEIPAMANASSPAKTSAVNFASSSSHIPSQSGPEFLLHSQLLNAIKASSLQHLPNLNQAENTVCFPVGNRKKNSAKRQEYP
ncbi:MAG: hypothetical protein QM796_01570, partial [Chthoniobacteraceae bacterium]